MVEPCSTQTAAPVYVWRDHSGFQFTGFQNTGGLPQRRWFLRRTAEVVSRVCKSVYYSAFFCIVLLIDSQGQNILDAWFRINMVGRFLSCVSIMKAVLDFFVSLSALFLEFLVESLFGAELLGLNKINSPDQIPFRF